VSKNFAKHAREACIDVFIGLLRPHAIPPTLLHEILHEAAQRAGWRPPSVRAQQRQKTAGRSRQAQRRQNMMVRRVFVAIFFKELPRGLRKTAQSLATAQAIIGRLQDISVVKTATVRTIQADIRFLIDNGNFGL
jgi:hypothetical protein